MELSTFVRITLREIHSDLRGVKFYYNKKVRVGFVVYTQAAMYPPPFLFIYFLFFILKKGLINHLLQHTRPAW